MVTSTGKQLRVITDELSNVIRDLYHEGNVRDSGILWRALEKIVQVRDRIEDVERIEEQWEEAADELTKETD